MTLALGMGNTNIMVGGIDDEQAYFVKHITTDPIKISLEYAVSIKDMLEIHHISASEIEGTIISSVVPPLNATLSSAIKKILDFRSGLVGSSMKTGLNIYISNPKTVGNDLIVDAVVAIKEYPCPLIIIDIGTATAIYAVNVGGNYISGIIYPGLKILPETLSSRTAQLSNVSLDIPPHVIGKNTIDCIRSSIVYGNAGMLNDTTGRMEQKLDVKATTLATGGFSRFIVPLCKYTAICEEDLMLEGLLILYDKSK